MRVLVTWGSKRGGTEGIALMIAEALAYQGIDVAALPARQMPRAAGFDAVIVGGALYANRWHPAARRFVSRRAKELRDKPVWFFSSGPLDASADERTIPPSRMVEALMERVGAQGHATFGGRLAPDAEGFPASAMAKQHAGDWRNPERIRAWASTIARELPMARPRAAMVPPGGSIARLLGHGAAGWALCVATMGLLLAVAGTGTALLLHALAAPIVFTAVSTRYFRLRGARAALPTALTFAGVTAALDLVVVAGLAQRSLATFASPLGTWLPLALIFLVTWITGALFSTLPWPKAPPRAAVHS